MLLSRSKAAGLGLLFTVALSIPAYAQQSGPSTGQPYPECKNPVSASDSTAAHDRYTAGKVDYDEGNNDKALLRFNEAYKLDCTKHELLIIISAAWDKKGEKAEAARALQTFLDRAQNVTEADRETYQKKIKRLKEEAEKKQPPPPPPTAPPPPSGGGEEGGHTIYPWIVAGVGVATLAVGIVLVVTAPELPPGCVKGGEIIPNSNPPKVAEGKGSCGNLPTDKIQDDPDTRINENDELAARQKEAGRSQEQPLYGAIVAAVGGALIVGGVIWYLLEPTGEKKTSTGKTRFQPALAPTYGGLWLTHTF